MRKKKKISYRDQFNSQVVVFYNKGACRAMYGEKCAGEESRGAATAVPPAPPVKVHKVLFFLFPTKNPSKFTHGFLFFFLVLVCFFFHLTSLLLLLLLYCPYMSSVVFSPLLSPPPSPLLPPPPSPTFFFTFLTLSLSLSLCLSLVDKKVFTAITTTTTTTSSTAPFANTMRVIVVHLSKREEKVQFH